MLIESFYADKFVADPKDEMRSILGAHQRVYELPFAINSSDGSYMYFHRTRLTKKSNEIITMRWVEDIERSTVFRSVEQARQMLDQHFPYRIIPRTGGQVQNSGNLFMTFVEFSEGSTIANRMRRRRVLFRSNEGEFSF